MNDTPTAYREAKFRIWSILLNEIYSESDTTEQIHDLSERAKQVISFLLSLRSSGMPEPLLHHFLGWAAYFEDLRERNMVAENLGLFSVAETPAEGSFKSDLVGIFAEVTGLASLGRNFSKLSGVSEDRENRQKQFDADLKQHRKVLARIDKDRVKLERQLPTIGKKFVKGYRPADYVALRKRSGTGPEASRYEGMGMAPEGIKEVLSSLPGGEQLSSIELFHESGRPFIVAGSKSEGFQLIRSEDDGDYHVTEREDIPLDEAMVFVTQFIDKEPGWFAGIDWKLHQ